MDSELELVKVRILANHLQRKIYVSGSFVFAVSVFVIFLTGQIRVHDPISLFILIFFMFLIGYSTIIEVRKKHVRNLAYIDRLLKKIENGEALPSLIELEKMKDFDNPKEEKES